MSAAELRRQLLDAQLAERVPELEAAVQSQALQLAEARSALATSGAKARASPATPLSIPRLAAPRTDRPEDKGGGARRMRPSVDDLDTENMSVQLAEAEAALLG